MVAHCVLMFIYVFILQFTNVIENTIIKIIKMLLLQISFFLSKRLQMFPASPRKVTSWDIEM